MVIARKRVLTMAAVGLAAVSSASLLYEIFRIHQVQHFNDALRSKTFAELSANGSVYGLFAKAYASHQRGEFDEALEAYAEVQEFNVPIFSSAAKYNMANLYLQKASEAERDDAQDIAVPLVELAKYQYRALLRANRRDWRAKYNLERALQLSPDLYDDEPEEDIMPERSPQAAGAVETHQELP